MLMEVQTPEMDGPQFVSTRRQPAPIYRSSCSPHASWPIIARSVWMAAAMDEYAAKPVSSSESFAAVDRVVPTVASRRFRSRVSFMAQISPGNPLTTNFAA